MYSVGTKKRIGWFVPKRISNHNIVRRFVHVKTREGKNITEYGKTVRKRLIDIEKTQEWLREQVVERTGLYIDAQYMTKILNGQRGAPKVKAAINEILGLEAG